MVSSTNSSSAAGGGAGAGGGPTTTCPRAITPVDAGISLYAPLTRPGQMVADGTSIVLTTNQTLAGVDTGTWTATTLVGDASLSVAGALAVNATSFYFFATQGNDPLALFSYPRSGGALSKVADAPNASQDSSFGTLAIDSGHAYWIELAEAPASSSLMAAPLGGGPAQVIADAGIVSGGVAVDATSIYWTTISQCDYQEPCGGVYAMPLAGGPPRLLTSSVNQPTAIVPAGDSLYVLDVGLASTDCGSQDGQLLRLSLTGGPSEVLADGLLGVRGVALGSDVAYVAMNHIQCGSGASAPGVLAVPFACGAPATLILSPLPPPGAGVPKASDATGSLLPGTPTQSSSTRVFFSVVGTLTGIAGVDE